MQYEYSPFWLERLKHLTGEDHTMKKNKKKDRGSNDDVVVISREDWKGRKKFPIAPGGKYRFRYSKKSSIKPNSAGTGNVLNLISTLTSLHNGKKTKHKGVNVFDNIAPHVGWKIAQVLRSMGIKKAPKKMTLKELLKLILKFDKEVREVIGTNRFQGKTRNVVIQYLPLQSSKDEDDEDTEDDDDIDDDEDNDDNEEDSDDEDSDDDDDDSDDEDDDDSDDDDDDDEDEDEDEDDNEDDDDEDDDDDDDDDDEDDRPSRHKKSSKSKTKKRRK